MAKTTKIKCIKMAKMEHPIILMVTADVPLKLAELSFPDIAHEVQAMDILRMGRAR